jgi:lipopolysaccharide transport system ATP-binding protein
MYVRLAFAVAAHLEPEILIVDEVLAVGDAQFQKKCLGKMEDVGKEGRTVLFVSHNMATIQQLCNSGIFLSQGELIVNDTIELVMTKYLLAAKSLSNMNNFDTKTGIKVIDIYIKSKEKEFPINTLIFNNDYILTIRINLDCSIKNACVVIKIHNQLGVLISSVCSPEEGIERLTLEGSIEINFDLPNLQLFPNQYKVSLFIYDAIDPQPYYSAEDIFNFEVLGSIIGNSWIPYRQDQGIVRICDNMSIKCLI